MKIFYEYQAQHPDHKTEYWTIIRGQDQEETSEDYKSPVNKIEASICIPLKPSNYPVATILPADRGRDIADVYHNYKDLYFLIFSNREMTIEIISSACYTFEEAIKILSKYRNILFPMLLKLLPRKGFYIRDNTPL